MPNNFCDKRPSTAANEISRQWAVRQSTAHRLEFRRALYLTSSDKNYGEEVGKIRGHLLPLTKYLVNGQYTKVQPIASNFAERCI